MKLPRSVYLIRHNITGRIYIGSSADVEKRHAHHMYSLRSGTHPVEDMQKDFDEYGDNFTFTVIDEITTQEELSKEYQWMQEFKSNIRGVGYNYKDRAVCKAQNSSKPDTQKDMLIRKINSLAEATNDIDLLDLIVCLLKDSAKKCS